MSSPEPAPDEIAALLQVEHLLDQRWPETKIEPSTARISALMELLGSPQLGYPSIHIAGTNGKTSVARMVDALLTALHRRTGRTTSPHLQSAVERISIDGRPISPATYVDTYREIEPFVRAGRPASRRPAGARHEQVRGRHRDGVRRVRRRADRRRGRRGRAGRALGRHQRRQRARRGDHPDRHRPHRLSGRHHRRDRRREGRHHHQAGRRPGADRHRRGDRPAGARGDGGAARRRRCAPTPRWRARIPSSRCWAARSPSADSYSNCRASAGCTPRSSCRCTASIRPTTPCSRWPPSRRSSAQVRNASSTSTRCARASRRSPRPAGWSGMRSAPTVFIDAAHNPAGAAALASRSARGVRFPLPGRRGLRHGRQGHRRHPRRARAGVRPDRRDPQRLAAGAGRRGSRHQGRGDVSGPSGSSRRRRCRTPSRPPPRWWRSPPSTPTVPAGSVVPAS